MGQEKSAGILATLRMHPYLVGFMLACLVTGAVCGYLWLTPEWHVARRILGGALGGVGAGLCVAAPRLFFEDE